MLTDKAMKAEELRIGNYLKFKKGPGECTVEAIFKKAVDMNLGQSIKRSCNLIDLEGVHPTKEILERIGFEPHLNQLILSAGSFLFVIEPRGDVYLNRTLVKVRWVHEIQNLYFALTGEELTLKP